MENTIINIDADDLEFTHPKLNAFLHDSELYYGFTNSEMIEFLKKLNNLGYECEVSSKNEEFIFNPNQIATKNEIDLYIGFQPINFKQIMNENSVIANTLKVDAFVRVLKTPISERYCKVGDEAKLDLKNNKIRCGGAWFNFDDRWIVESYN